MKPHPFAPRNGIRLSRSLSMTAPRWQFVFSQNRRMQTFRSLCYYLRADCARQRDLALHELVKAGLKVMNAQTVFDNPEQAKADIAAGKRCVAVGFSEFLAKQVETLKYWKDRKSPIE